MGGGCAFKVPSPRLRGEGGVLRLRSGQAPRRMRGATRPISCRGAPHPAFGHPLPASGERDLNTKRSFAPLAGRRCREAADEGRHSSQFLPSGAPHPASLRSATVLHGDILYRTAETSFTPREALGGVR